MRDKKIREDRTQERDREGHHDDELDTDMLDNRDKRAKNYYAAPDPEGDRGRGPSIVLPCSNR